MRYRMLLLLLLLIPLIYLSGCTSKGGGGNAVVFMLPATKTELKTWKDAITDFTSQTKMKIDLEGVAPTDYWHQLHDRISCGDAPDVAIIPSARFPQLAVSNKLTDLNQYLKGQTEINKQDFFPVTWQAYQYRGATLGIPLDIDTVALAYNQDAFDVAYVNPPQKSWTWAEYLKMAKALTTFSQITGRIKHYGTVTCPWWPLFVWQNGGALVDSVTDPKRSTLSTPAAEQALQFLANLSLKYHVAPPPTDLHRAEGIGLFEQGQAATAFVTRHEVPGLHVILSFRWDTMAIPHGKKTVNLASGSCFSILQGSKHAADAWKLVSYLAGQTGQMKLIGGGFYVPAQEALANSQYFASGLTGNPNPFVKGIKFAHALPFTPRYADIEKVYAKELPALWSGQATAAQVCAKIDSEVDQILNTQQPSTAWLLLGPETYWG